MVRAAATAAAVVVAVAVAGTALAGLYVGIVWLRLPGADDLDRLRGPDRGEGVRGEGADRDERDGGERDGGEREHGAGPDRGDPGPTAFMRADGCRAHARTYRPLSAIDPRLGCAVVWAEDAGMFGHDGVDGDALADAIRDGWRRGAIRHGGSTIAMQLSRNLYLSRARTPSRKLREVLLAPRLVARLGRRRVLELYLNAAEWAPCVYGADAAARHYLGHGADVVTVAEAVFLAAMLPRPGTPPGRDDRDRSRLVARQQALVTHLRRAGLLTAGAARTARAEILAHAAGGFRARSRTAGAVDVAVAGDTARRDGMRATDIPAPMAWYGAGCGTLRPEAPPDAPADAPTDLPGPG